LRIQFIVLPLDRQGGRNRRACVVSDFVFVEYRHETITHDFVDGSVGAFDCNEKAGKALFDDLVHCLGQDVFAEPGATFDVNTLGAEGLLDHIAGHSDDGIPLQRCMTCGPTLVVRREQSADEPVYCRNCGGEYRLERSRNDLQVRVEPTGRQGHAKELAPAADTALIRRFVQDTAVHALSSSAGH
jgi:DNA-directed RNA polymerase subunit RPC12/RpoP